MPEPKAQLVDPQGPIDVPGLQVTGVTTATGGFVGNVQGSATGLASTTTNLNVGIVTATKFSGNTTGNVSGLADDTNINVGIITSTSFTGDLVGNAAGLSTTTANIKAGIMSATSFAGNFTGVASGITGTPNIVVGIMTGTLKGDGSGLTGIAATNWIANNVTTTSATTYAINVTASGSSAYTLSGNDRNGSVSGSNAGVAVNVGDTLNFAVNASGHPFYIRVSNGGANVSTPAATNQGTQSGTVSWTPNTAGTYYYQCGNHSGMIGTITVSDSTTSINLSDGNVIYFTQNVDTTVSFANTGTSNIVSFIRPGVDYTITWPSSIKWDGGSAPTLGKYEGDNDVFTLLTRDEGVTWYGWEDLSIGPYDYQIYTLGANEYGYLGQNNRTYYSSPVQIPGTTWKKQSAGSGSGYAITSGGEMWAWGSGGSGSLAQNNETDYSSPVQIPGTTWASHATYNGTSLATKTDGTLWAWASNGNGELGQNDRTQRSSPVQIPGTNWSQSMKAISVGEGECMGAIKTDGTLWTWGGQQYGELGQNQQTAKYSSPTQVPGTTWSKVCFVGPGTLLTKTDGTLWAMGSNSYGVLGLNNTTKYSSPAQIPGTTWSTISASRGTMSGALKTDGTLWMWGYNPSGNLGQNNRTNYSSPKQIPGTTWTGNILMSSTTGACAKTDGTLWIWGEAETGNLGQNDTTRRSSPVQIPGTNWNTEFNSSVNGNKWMILSQRT